MKTMILGATVLGTLALFNPAPDDFSQFIRERVQDVVSDHARALGGSMLGGTGSSLAGTVSSALLGNAVERKNYGVCSIYTLDLNGARNPGGEWTFFGIGGQFIEMDKPQVLEQ